MRKATQKIRLERIVNAGTVKRSGVAISPVSISKEERANLPSLPVTPPIIATKTTFRTLAANFHSPKCPKSQKVKPKVDCIGKVTDALTGIEIALTPEQKKEIRSAQSPHYLPEQSEKRRDDLREFAGIFGEHTACVYADYEGKTLIRPLQEHQRNTCKRKPLKIVYTDADKTQFHVKTQ